MCFFSSLFPKWPVAQTWKSLTQCLLIKMRAILSRYFIKDAYFFDILRFSVAKISTTQLYEIIKFFTSSAWIVSPILVSSMIFALKMDFCTQSSFFKSNWCGNEVQWTYVLRPAKSFGFLILEHVCENVCEHVKLSSASILCHFAVFWLSLINDRVNSFPK